jgi:hypothetical protein
MVKPGFEIFHKGPGCWGLILKSPNKFKRLNSILYRYPPDSRMEKGEEALFWVPLGMTETVAKILAPRSSINSQLFRSEEE